MSRPSTSRVSTSSAEMRLGEGQDQFPIEPHRIGRAARLRLDEQEADATFVLVDVQGQRVVDREIDPRQLQRRRVDVLGHQRARPTCRRRAFRIWRPRGGLSCRRYRRRRRRPSHSRGSTLIGMASEPASSGSGAGTGVSSEREPAWPAPLGSGSGSRSAERPGRRCGFRRRRSAVKATAAARATPAAMDTRRVICVDRFGRSSTRVVISMVPSLIAAPWCPVRLIRRDRRFTTYE